MDLVGRCQAEGWNRIAFVGATKHAGKTTALNHLVAEAHAKGVAVGLCSIGLDGERLDTILGVEKPAVHAPEGAIVASAERALAESTAGLEWLEVLPLASPLGAVAVCRVTRAGSVVLAGVRQRAHLRIVLPRLETYGARLQLVDGAFDRIAAAAPALVDAVVLAVGAVAGRTVDAILRHARPFIQRFLLPTVPGDLRNRLAMAQQRQVVGWVDGTDVHVIEPSGTLAGVPHHAWTPDVEAVYLPGAVTDSLVSGLLAHGRPLTVVAAHPAQVLLSESSYRKLLQAGHCLCVWETLPILAVAANPHSIEGYDVPRQALLDGLSAWLGDVPVFDPLHPDGICTQAGASRCEKMP
ncbi:hypothetical protein GCM10025857_22250 [Alicyclobacillus contaminans]|nr:hypothetical protein GCM10025857_22250 [Alicyclobacillus contaminans]